MSSAFFGGGRRRRYRVRLHAGDIRLSTEDGPDPIVGFYTTRFVRAASPEQASAFAIAIVRSDWFNSPYSTINRGSGPTISIREIELIRNPFRRSRPNRGYEFYKEEHATNTQPEPGGDP